VLFCGVDDGRWQRSRSAGQGTNKNALLALTKKKRWWTKRIKAGKKERALFYFNLLQVRIYEVYAV